MFSKGGQILDFQHGSVIQYCLAGEASEHLVAAVIDEQHFGAGSAVVKGVQGQVQPPLFIMQMPGLVVVRLPFKPYPANFAVTAIIEQHIFGGLAGVAETGSQIETEDLPIHHACTVGPVPLIVEGPHASPPVQQTESIFTKTVFLTVNYTIKCNTLGK